MSEELEMLKEIRDGINGLREDVQKMDKSHNFELRRMSGDLEKLIARM
jgi:hypothetical protein